MEKLKMDDLEAEAVETESENTSPTVKTEDLIEEIEAMAAEHIVEAAGHEVQTVDRPRKTGKNTYSIFKRIDSALLHGEHGVAQASTSMHGKLFQLQMIAKEIVRFNAVLTSRQLEFRSGKYATSLKKLIDSCIANAKQKGLDAQKLYIQSIMLGRGAYLKRRECKGRGRSGAIWRPHTNIYLKLKEVNFGQ